MIGLRVYQVTESNVHHYTAPAGCELVKVQQYIDLIGGAPPFLPVRLKLRIPEEEAAELEEYKSMEYSEGKRGDGRPEEYEFFEKSDEVNYKVLRGISNG